MNFRESLIIEPDQKLYTVSELGLVLRKLHTKSVRRIRNVLNIEQGKLLGW